MKIMNLKIKFNLVLSGLLIIMLALTATGCKAKTSQIGYEEAYDIGLQAYTYGLPLLETNKTFLKMTDASSGMVNQFIHVRSLNDSKSKAVVAPGASGLSSIAWLDLTKEAQVLHIPEVTDHYFVLALLDPYTEDISNLGSAHDTPAGDYVICGPSQHEMSLPSGTNQINVEYTRIWIIGSTQVKDSNDIPNVNKIQDGFAITPFSKYGTDYQPTTIEQTNTKLKNYDLPTGLEFFDTLCQLIQQFPPPEADKPQLKAFESVGIGPGLIPSQDPDLSVDIIQGLTDAAAAGPEKIKADTKTFYEASAKKHNGYLLGGFGNYGTNYQLRAVIAAIGLGALSSDQTIFALTFTDKLMKPLDGSNSYVMHMAVPPPTKEGWSITVYDSKGMLIQNSINRNQFNDSSKLTINADGSVDIFFQAFQPADATEAVNWLPVTSGQGFQVIIRLMAPEQNSIKGILDGSGWQPPALSSQL
jgi:hypothetical protein